MRRAGGGSASSPGAPRRPGGGEGAAAPGGGVIRASDRVSAVIGRDERLIDVFVSLSPAFERLRKPAMRKVMSRLVTVEQAARMAGVDPDALVARLNQAIAGDLAEAGRAPSASGPGGAGAQGTTIEAERSPSRVARAPEDAEPRSPDGGPTEAAPAERPRGDRPAGAAMPPAELRGVAGERIVDLDVREDLRQGREPFSRIMAARRSLPEGGVLRLRAIFEPVPLYAVMAKQGFAHWTERLAEDDWRVWFYPAGAADASAAGATDLSPAGSADADSPGASPSAEPAAHRGDAEAAGTPEDGDGVVVLDVRGLEPPEPMLRTLEAAERLPPGGTLVQINVRVPQFLLPQLEARGFTYEVREQQPGLVRVFIRRRADG
ncbi:MAG TPA: DUF2249 domain-containing protein [Longimicrobiales bacterium]